MFEPKTTLEFPEGSRFPDRDGVEREVLSVEFAVNGWWHVTFDDEQLHWMMFDTDPRWEFTVPDGNPLEPIFDDDGEVEAIYNHETRKYV